MHQCRCCFQWQMTWSAIWISFSSHWRIKGNENRQLNRYKNSFNFMRIRKSKVLNFFSSWKSNLDHTFSLFLFCRMARDLSKLLEITLLTLFSYVIIGICSNLLMMKIKMVFRSNRWFYGFSQRLIGGTNWFCFCFFFFIF